MATKKKNEEPRKLMLGIIDDLPEERSRDARQRMMWGLSLAVVLVLFVVLVWVTASSQ
jgi:hypothetical protein